MPIAQYIHEITHLTTVYDAFVQLKTLSKQIGLDRFMMLDLRPLDNTSLAEQAIISNWDSDLMKRFDDEGLMVDSPLLHLLRTQNRAIYFSIDELAAKRQSEDEGNKVVAMFREFGMPYGYYFPVHAGFGLHGAISFLGGVEHLDDALISQLHTYTLYLFDHVINKVGIADNARLKLSTRELECLKWTAEGKTSGEIAIILSLSGHTVNHYITSATTKLNAVSRAHAIAKAIRQGMI